MQYHSRANENFAIFTGGHHCRRCDEKPGEAGSASFFSLLGARYGVSPPQ